MNLREFLDAYDWGLTEIVYVCNPNTKEMLKLSSCIDLFIFNEYREIALQKVSFFQIIDNQLYVHIKKN